MSHVAVVATGGTIANTLERRISISQVFENIAQHDPDSDPRKLADVTVREVLRAGAESFTPTEWITIGRAVRECAVDPAIDGVVVTHGTFTAEETAYFLHLSIRTDKPIVVACSQRKHGTLGNDGDKNLYDAVRVAASPSAVGRGVIVLLNEEMHCARDVIKTNHRPDGFQSGSMGLLGTVEVDQIAFYRSPSRRHTGASELNAPSDFMLPRVDIVATYPGADGVAIRSFVQAGAQGIVVNGYSFNGKPHSEQLPALIEAAEQGIPVVLVNRGGDGRVPVDPSDGFVCGDNLTAQKARVLLMLGLLVSKERAELQRIFGEY